MKSLVPLLLLLAATSASAAQFAVTSASDDGSPGTLRWAIEQSNSTPGVDRITFTRDLTIFPLTALPPITDAVTMEGRSTIVDGASSTADVGLRIDGDGSGIYYLSFRNWRGTAVEVRGQRNRLEYLNAGVLRVEPPNPSWGDGITLVGDRNEVAYGRFEGLRRGVVVAGDTNQVHSAVIVRSRDHGIEVLDGASDAFIGSETRGCQLLILCFPVPSGNYVGESGKGGIVVAGNDARIWNNYSDDNAAGIVVTGARPHLRGNSTSQNRSAGVILPGEAWIETQWGQCNGGGLLIDVGGDGRTFNEAGETDGAQNAPVITSVVADTSATTIEGYLQSTPSSWFSLHLLARDAACRDWDEEIHAGWVATDATGRATFRRVLAGHFDSGVAMRAVYWSTGNLRRQPRSSELSDVERPRVTGIGDADLRVTTQANKTQARRGEDVTFTITVTNRGPAAVSRVALTISATGGTIEQMNVQKPLSSINTYSPCEIGFCYLGPIGSGESFTIVQTMRVTAVNENVVHTASVDFSAVPGHYIDRRPKDNTVTTIIPTSSRRRRS